mgnify:CR=1 FL=1
MEELLNLFVIIYLKCSQEVQLTLVDDVDKCIEFIQGDQEAIFKNKKFTFNLIFMGLYQFKHCMKAKKLQGTNAKDCDHLKLSSIKKRCKQYDTNIPQNQYLGHNAKTKFQFMECHEHGKVDFKEA